VADIGNCECFITLLAGDLFTNRGCDRGGLLAIGKSPFKPSELSLAANQNKSQLLAQFMDGYLPPKTSGSITYQSPVYWVETLSSLVDSQSRLVNESLSALVLIHIAKSRKDNALSHCSRHSYGLLMQQILGLRQLSDPTDLIRTGMILALYETYDSVPNQDNAWQIHVEAACNLMWQSHLSTWSLNDHDLRRLCTIEVGCCICFPEYSTLCTDRFRSFASASMALIGTLRLFTYSQALCLTYSISFSKFCLKQLHYSGIFDKRKSSAI